MPLRDDLRHAWVVARKDLLVEYRSRTAIVSAVAFVILVLLVFNFSHDPTAVSSIDLAPSVLWVTLDGLPVGELTLRGGAGTLPTYNMGDFGVSRDSVQVYNTLPDVSGFTQLLSGSRFSASRH